MNSEFTVLKACVRKRAMKATIWHNPACGTSRKTLAILQETPGIDLTVVEYLKNPYSADKLRQLFGDAGLNAREALRLRGTDAEERGLKDASEDEIIAAMAANPAYVERPIVETEKGVRLCRPQDRVLEIL
jgi:arsenate reductase